jgi:hypothetical protein
MTKMVEKCVEKKEIKPQPSANAFNAKQVLGPAYIWAYNCCLLKENLPKEENYKLEVSASKKAKEVMKDWGPYTWSKGEKAERDGGELGRGRAGRKNFIRKLICFPQGI